MSPLCDNCGHTRFVHALGDPRLGGNTQCLHFSYGYSHGAGITSGEFCQCGEFMLDPDPDPLPKLVHCKSCGHLPELHVVTSDDGTGNCQAGCRCKRFGIPGIPVS